MSLRPADSWYEATAGRGPALPPLEGDVEADVCVVGAGLSGCSTALHLAERGYKVVVLEAERIGYGASGRSGGQIIPGRPAAWTKLAAQLGKGDAKRLWDFSVEGVGTDARADLRNQIDCDLAWGHMHVGIKPRQREELLEWQREQEGDFGYRKLRFMERDEVESVDREQALRRRDCSTRARATCIRCDSPSASARLRSPQARASTSTAASRTSITARRSRCSTDRGSVRAKFVALCANVGHVDLSDRLARKLIGVASYIVATKPLGEARARRSSRTTSRSPTSTGSSTTIRLSSDHRLLFGGRVSYSGLDPLGTARATRSAW